MNAMIYVRGNRLDYDHWAGLGNKGWSVRGRPPLLQEIGNAAARRFRVSRRKRRASRVGFARRESFNASIPGRG